MALRTSSQTPTPMRTRAMRRGCLRSYEGTSRICPVQVLTSSPFVGAGWIGGVGRSPAAWVSRFRNAPSSPIVLIKGNLNKALEVAQLQRERVGHHHVRGMSELTRRERLPLGRDDLRALLTLSLSLASHRALHAVRQLNVTQLDNRDLNTPLLGLNIKDLLDVLVDLVSL